MIFVTVGTQLPFDRMIKIIDEWAGKNNRTDIYAQIGPTDYCPKNFESTKFIGPKLYSDWFNNSEIIISHAGMGTILKSLELGKPLLIFPRNAKFGEHRNDHQIATAARFKELNLFDVALDESELLEKLNNIENLSNPEKISLQASSQLIDALREFIEFKK